MKSPLKIGFAAAALAALSFAAYRTTVPVSAAETESFSEGQVKSIEKIVREYLINHPEVMLEVQEAYEKRAEAKRGEATRSRMPEFYKSLASMKTELAPFSIGKGDVTLVEFFDYNCGYCRQTLPELLKLADTDKNVKVQFIEFPILAPGSTEASKVAIAAAKQGKYVEFHKAMFAAGRASKESALKVAEQIGLNMDKVKADMASPETEALLTKMTEIARRIFVDGTPSFIAGDKVSPGAADFDQLKQFVDAARAEGCKACSEAAASGAKEEKKS
ncbi:MAG TPA: DsbA family protein [Hyphomicrobiales bacterium]|nr:DsbA family protein [Hyphomicrobiales bacterium]